MNAAHFHAQIHFLAFCKRSSSWAGLFKLNYIRIKNRPVFANTEASLASAYCTTKTCTRSAKHSVFHAKKGLYSAFPCNLLNINKHWCWPAGINCLVATFLYLLGSQGSWQHTLNSYASIVRSDCGVTLYVFQTVSSAFKAGVKVVACGRQG